MRKDALGLFWEDLPPPPKEKLTKPKRIPPEPVWLKEDYLPNLEEALAFDIQVMTPDDIRHSWESGHALVFDIECYINYFLASFLCCQTGKVIYFEAYEGHPLDINGLSWVIDNFLTVGFNSYSYDLPVTAMALAGKTNAFLKNATNQIIGEGLRGNDVLRNYKIKPLRPNHIDLIEVAPLRASLKIYAGRLHARRMQELPFHPDTTLNDNQIACVRWYNLSSDLPGTQLLQESLGEQLKLRYTLSKECGLDLRSKSDAQIAEAILGNAIQKRMGRFPGKPVIEIGTRYKYKTPHFIRFRSPLLQWALSVIEAADFIVDESGSIAMPEEIKALKLDLNGSVYRMGIGGLHSSEKSTYHVSDENYILKDVDATSFYPFIILILRLFPKHLGEVFLEEFRKIVDRRVAAKNAKDKVTADSLKITINGSFGKLGSKYSILYAPDLLIQVTITGQLSLLMLIEMIEYSGIHVVSANTDGIVIKCPRQAEKHLAGVIKEWEMLTGFQTEEAIYKALFSRDVNNYMAIKEDGTTKCKGAYANPWAGEKLTAERLHKNPTNSVCVEAVEAYLTKGTPLMQTLKACQDISKFVSVRTVKGGAVKVWPDKTEYVGKAIRWYYATGVEGELVYATNGNKVPKSDGAKPLLDLPRQLPQDIDYGWYETEAVKILEGLGLAFQ